MKNAVTMLIRRIRGTARDQPAVEGTTNASTTTWPADM